MARSHTETAIKVLAEIMADPSASPSVRAAAATEIINRGWGQLADPTPFVVDRREHYVYSIHARDGSLIYVGKGLGRRSVRSAFRLAGKARIRAVFTSEKQALAFERRLIVRFRPRHNVLHNSAAGRELN